MSSDRVVGTILMPFWIHFGSLMGGFLDHFGVKLNSKIVLEAPWELCPDHKSIFLSSTPPILGHIGSLMRAFLVIFVKFFLVIDFVIGYHLLLSCFFHWFSYAPCMQKWTNCIGGPSKFKFSCCSLSNVFGNRFWKDFGFEMAAVLGPNWPSEVISRSSVVKYTNEEGAESINYPATPPTL